MLLLALSVGGLLAFPQLWLTLRYYPHSIRAGKTASQKMELGNISLWTQLRNMVAPSVEPVDGVFGPEACTFIGLPALLCTFFAGWSWWWSLLGVSVSLAMGRHTPLFRLTHRVHLRIPARYCYFVSLSLAFLSLQGFSTFAHQVAARKLPDALLVVLVLLQALSLLTVLPQVWPMEPYVQRWERPSKAFDSALTRYLSPSTLGGLPGRVSGLSYPLRTGQINQLQTLGYNGGSQAKWMARFRNDVNPNGSGAHDWFALNEDGKLLDWYGVKYAYTYRPLHGKWRSTAVPHLYENTAVAVLPPSWKEVANRYGNVRKGGNPV